MKSNTTFCFILLACFFISYSQTPLMETNWGQGCYYNALCPDNAAGPCSKVYVGCNATALAQIMKYHEHPATGWGSHSYNSSYGLLSADFSATTYDWSAMPNNLNEDNMEVAQLMYHLGVAAEMLYGPAISNSLFNGDEILKKHFKYSLKIKSEVKFNHTNESWENLIISEIDAGRVVFVRSSTHFYIIDGYKTTPTLEFHANFGWGGIHNGYFDIHNIKISKTDFTPNAVMIGVEPLTELELSKESISTNSGAIVLNFQMASLTDWTVTSDQPWAVPGVMSGTEGFYDASNGAKVSLTENDSYESRWATLEYSDGEVSKTLTIEQKGIEPNLNISDSNLGYGAIGGTQSITMTTDSMWVATPSHSWIHVTPATGTGSGSLDISADASTILSERVGSVEITRGHLSETINITQDAFGSTWCTPALITGSGNGVTNVTFNTINRTSGIDEGYILTADHTEVTKGNTYTLNVSFSGENAPAIWIDWNQDGNFLGPDEDIIGFTWYPTNDRTQSIDILVPEWAQEGETRMRIYSKVFGSGPVSGPCGTGDDGGDIEDFVITIRDSRYLDVDPASLHVDASALTETVAVACDSIWLANTTDTWLSLSDSEGSGNQELDVSYQANPKVVSRTGKVFFTRGDLTKELTVNQMGMDSIVSVTPDTLHVTSIGGVQSFDINANIDYTIASDVAWAIPDLLSATGDQSINLTINNNPNAEERIGRVFVENGAIKDTLTIVQELTSPIFELSQTDLDFDADGGDNSLEITAGSSWIASTSDSWIIIDINSSDGNANINISTEANETLAERYGVITFTNGVLVETLEITQQAEVLGLDSQEASGALLLYPNPSAGTLVLKTTAIENQIVIHDIMGKEVFRKTYHEHHKVEMDISHLVGGIYFVTLNNAKKLKLIKR